VRRFSDGEMPKLFRGEQPWDLVVVIDQFAGISVSQRHYHSMLQLPSSHLLIRQTFPVSECIANARWRSPAASENQQVRARTDI